eukprot:c39418_g1_i1 orf=22-198(-)
MRAEHFSYASHALAPFIAHLFNRALFEGFQHTWAVNTITFIHRARDTINPEYYKTRPS